MLNPMFCSEVTAEASGKLSVATKQPVSPLFKRKYHLSFNYLFRLLAVQFPCCLGPDGSSRMTRRNFHANV
jgi:hypothetical protein